MISEISRPTLLLDIARVRKNIDNMLSRAKRLGVDLVPHFKTHQSKEVGTYFTERGVRAITVSSVLMAEYFAENGWKDITIAFPFNRLETQAINRLIENNVKVKLLVTDKDTVRHLAKHLNGGVELLIEVDAGYKRSGVDASNHALVKSIVEEISAQDNVSLYGLYCHPGDTYHAESLEEIKLIWSSAIDKLNTLKTVLSPMCEELRIRMGDTPGCSVVGHMEGIDEIGPGNFVFFDLVMNYLGVCSEDEIAVAVACPVVAKYAERGEIVIHGGAVHFSKDHLFDGKEQKFFGEMVVIEENGWSSIIPEAKLISISQEHGILKVNEEVFDTLAIGDVVGILPIHSCLTANLMKGYLTFSNEWFEHA